VTILTADSFSLLIFNTLSRTSSNLGK